MKRIYFSVISIFVLGSFAFADLKTDIVYSVNNKVGINFIRAGGVATEADKGKVEVIETPVFGLRTAPKEKKAEKVSIGAYPICTELSKDSRQIMTAILTHAFATKKAIDWLVIDSRNPNPCIRDVIVNE